eukprot:1146613-Pelagomonas_calceolata.AAC.4
MTASEQCEWRASQRQSIAGQASPHPASWNQHAGAEQACWCCLPFFWAQFGSCWGRLLPMSSEEPVLLKVLGKTQLLADGTPGQQLEVYCRWYCLVKRRLN